MFKVSLENGKYEVTNDNGILTAKRHGKEWPAADASLCGDGLSLAMMHEIETLSLTLTGLGNPERPTQTVYYLKNRKTHETIGVTTAPSMIAGIAEGLVLGSNVKVWAIVVGSSAIPVNLAYLDPLPKGFPAEAGR